VFEHVVESSLHQQLINGEGRDDSLELGAGPDWDRLTDPAGRSTAGTHLAARKSINTVGWAGGISLLDGPFSTHR